MASFDTESFQDQKLNKAEEFLLSHGIDTVRVGAVDLDGIWRGKQFDSDYFLKNVVPNGTNIANILFGWDVADTIVEGLDYTNWDTGFPDIKLVPDLSTLRLVPWEPRVASVICDIKTLAGEPVTLSPRDLLRSAVAKAEEMGFVPKAACEFEFYLFDGKGTELANRQWRDLTPIKESGYCYSMLHQASSEDFFGQLRRHMKQAGVEMEATMSEHGPGQYEINLKYDDAMNAADKAIYAKYAIKDLAAKNGYTATFMAKPNAGWAGSSGHLHMSLSDKSGKPLFSNFTNSNMLSDIGLSFLAGLKEFSRDFSAIYLPNVNSYKRTNGGAWAAANSSWGIDNRTVSFRAIPSSSPAARVESRISGADANPYLIMTAAIHSGLYGIKNNMSAGQPYIGNAYKAPPEVAKPLARSLEEAMALFAASEVAKSFFPPEFVPHYLHMKKWELDQTNTHVTDWELKRYLEII
jgi:glutamine synthetase